MIIFYILTTLSLDNVWTLLGENCCWSLLGLKGLNKNFKAGLLIFRAKKAKFRGIFRGKFAEKSAYFAGKKSKFAEKSPDFAGFSREKSQNSQKNRPILQDFSGKKSNSKDFQWQILRKIGRFYGKFPEETSPRNN